MGEARNTDSARHVRMDDIQVHRHEAFRDCFPRSLRPQRKRFHERQRCDDICKQSVLHPVLLHRMYSGC